MELLRSSILLASLLHFISPIKQVKTNIHSPGNALSGHVTQDSTEQLVARNISTTLHRLASFLYFSPQFQPCLPFQVLLLGKSYIF